MQTKLDIINEGLGATGLTAVGSLDSAHPAFQRGLATFNRINTRLQLKGWWYNKYTRSFTPDSNGEIIIPQYAGSVIVLDNNDIIVRGTKLFNRDTRTNVIDGAVTCRVIEVLPIGDIPSQAVDHIAQTFVYSFYRDEDGVEPKLGEYRALMINAAAEMQAENLKHEDVNFFTGAAAATKLGYSSRKEGLY